MCNLLTWHIYILQYDHHQTWLLRLTSGHAVFLFCGEKTFQTSSVSSFEVQCLFHSFHGIFSWTEVLNVNIVQFIYFFIWWNFFVSYLRNVSNTKIRKMFWFSSNNFVLLFTFRLVIHLELTWGCAVNDLGVCCEWPGGVLWSWGQGCFFFFFFILIYLATLVLAVASRILVAA